jgi:hypothetical protein
MSSEAAKRAAVEGIRLEFEKSRDSRIWTDYVNALRLVSQVVFTRSSGFVLEFIQNAEDAGQGCSGKGEISVSVNQRRLKFIHNGRAFDESNLGAICGIRSSKKPERGTLGYLGIGFKSVFKVADCVEVYSNGYCFKFDRNAPEWSGRAADTPWHVIPIWLEQPSEPAEADKTTFIIHLRNEEAHAHLMEGLKAIRAELYLFLKWIKSISITDEVSGKIWTVEDSGSTGDGITTLKQDGEEHRFKFFRREVTVPERVKPDRLTQEYRANVTKREIAVAFAIDANGDLDPTPSTAMYGGRLFVPAAGRIQERREVSHSGRLSRSTGARFHQCRGALESLAIGGGRVPLSGGHQVFPAARSLEISVSCRVRVQALHGIRSLRKALWPQAH